MITPDEREQLNRINEAEADFYAPLLLLVLLRLPSAPMTAEPWPRSIQLESPGALRETILSAYRDVNEMMAEDPS